jgi:hypothetical protein
VQPIVTFAYVSGWRVQSGILPLEWCHVDRQKGEVRLDPGTTKNQVGRPVHRRDGNCSTHCGPSTRRTSAKVSIGSTITAQGQNAGTIRPHHKSRPRKLLIPFNAGVAELADAQDLKSFVRLLTYA